MQKRLIEFHKQALLKVHNQPQDGEGVTPRGQAEVDQRSGPVAPVESTAAQNITEPQRTNIKPKKNVPFQKEEIVLQNENLKIFVVKSDLKRMVEFKMLDHQFILRVEVKIKKNIF